MRAAAVGGVSWALGIEEGGEDGPERAGAGGVHWSRAYSPAVRAASAADGEAVDGAAGAEAAEAVGAAAAPAARAVGDEEETALVGIATRVGRDSRAMGLKEWPAAASSATAASVDLTSERGGSEKAAPAAKYQRDGGELSPWIGPWSDDRRWGEDDQQQQKQQQPRRRSSLRGTSISSPPPPPPPPPPVPTGGVISGNSGSVGVELAGGAAAQTIEIEQDPGRAGSADELASGFPGGSEGVAERGRFFVGRKGVSPEELREIRARKQQRQGKEEEEEEKEEKPARYNRALQEEAMVFPGGVELECNLVVPGTGVAEGGPTIIEPAEASVLRVRFNGYEPSPPLLLVLGCPSSRVCLVVRPLVD